jgi:hypothetical protein
MTENKLSDIIKDLVFRKITSNAILIGILCFTVVVASNFIGISIISEGHILTQISVIFACIVIGLSFGLTKNMVFPASIFVVYNMMILVLRDSGGFSLIDYLDILYWISQGLFIVFVTMFLPICVIYNRNPNNQLTQIQKDGMILICSVIAGVVTGLFMGVFAI